MRPLLVGVQAASFVALGVLLLMERDWRLGAAQFLLAAVTAVVYL